MDTTHLLLIAGSIAGMLLVGLMAIVPTAMETGSDPDPARPRRRPAAYRRTGALR